MAEGWDTTLAWWEAWGREMEWCTVGALPCLTDWWECWLAAATAKRVVKAMKAYGKRIEVRMG